MLHTLQHNGMIRVLGQFHKPLHAQHLLAMRRFQQAQKHIERRRRNRIIGRETKRPDMAVMPVHIMRILPVIMRMVMVVLMMVVIIMVVRMMMVIMSVIPIGFLIEPRRHIRALARKIKRPALHKVQRRKYIPLDIDNPRRRVECLEPRPQGGLDAACFIEQIGFRQHQPVRDCRLLHRLHVRVERCSTIHCIDQRHDPVNTVPRREIRVRHHRLQNRRGISQPRRLDNNPVELLDLPRIALPHQIIALTRISAVVAGLTFCLEPVVAAITSAIVLDERLGVTQYAGGALVIGAIMLNVWLESRRRA